MKPITSINLGIQFLLPCLFSTVGFMGCNRSDSGKSIMGETNYDPQKREYWISTQFIPRWDAVPLSESVMSNDSITDSRRYLWKTLRYVQTDSNWKVLPAPDWQALSGPILHAFAGDSVIVHFRNDPKADIPVSLHTHNFIYNEENEGAWRKDLPAGWPEGAVSGGQVNPGENFTYRWLATKKSVGVGPYHSHSLRPADEIARGLTGLVVIDPPPGSNDYIAFDTTVALVFKTYQTLKIISDSAVDTVMNGDSSMVMNTACDAPLIPWNGGCHPKEHVPVDQWPENLKIGDTTTAGPELQTINGLSYGNLPTFKFRKGQKVRFVVVAMNADGSENHTVHFHGEMLRELSRPAYYGDVFDLPSAMAQQLVLDADNVGRWMIHCHVEHHQNEMMATYDIVAKENANANP